MHVSSVSAEHFLLSTTGLWPRDECVRSPIGFSTREELLSYRMSVSEFGTRTTQKREVSSFSVGEWDGLSLAPVVLSEAFDMLAAELSRSR